MFFKTVMSFIVLLMVFLVTSIFGLYSTETMMLFFKYSTYVCLVALGYVAIIFLIFVITSAFNIPVRGSMLNIILDITSSCILLVILFLLSLAYGIIIVIIWILDLCLSLDNKKYHDDW